MLKSLAAFFGIVAFALGGMANAAQIKGDYVEARTADIYTGPCFSNAEIFITGSQAVMAWKVTEGKWDGVDLSGLTVAAAVSGTSTFSEDQPDKAKSVVIVDKEATPKQRKALVAMAKALAKGRLNNVVEVKSSLISMMVESPAADHSPAKADDAHAGHGMPASHRASLWVPNLAEILTRPLNDSDHFCGNESIAYEPMSSGVKVQPAYTLGNRFRGEGLNTTWNDPNCRSSFVGTFSY